MKSKIDINVIVAIILLLASTLYLGLTTDKILLKDRLDIEIVPLLIFLVVSICPLVIYFSNRKKNKDFLYSPILLIIVCISLYVYIPLTLFILFLSLVVLSFIKKGKSMFYKEDKPEKLS